MFQQTIIIGRLGNDPESKALPSGSTVTNLSVACTEKWKDKSSGEMQERTEWYRCVAFGRTAEIIEEYVKKGDAVHLVGKQRTEKWTDKEGADRYSTKLYVDSVTLIPNNRSGGGQREERNEQQERPAQRREERAAPKGRAAPAAKQDDFDDDIPF